MKLERSEFLRAAFGSPQRRAREERLYYWLDIPWTHAQARNPLLYGKLPLGADQRVASNQAEPRDGRPCLTCVT